MPISRKDLRVAKTLPLFETLTLERLAEAIGDAAATTHDFKETLFVRGDDADRFFVLLDGWVKLYRKSREGIEAIIEVMGPGEAFGEAAAIGLGRYPVSADCVTDVRLLEIPAETFKSRLLTDPKLMFGTITSLSLRLKRFVGRTEMLVTQNACQRVATFLLTFIPENSGHRPRKLTLPYNKLLIAGRLGMKPETFSRALSDLRRIGVVVSQSEVVIEDPLAVKRFAEGGLPR